MAKKTGSYFIKLESEESSPPSLISKVKPTDRSNRFHVSVIHPNTSEVLYEKVHTCNTLDEAMKLAHDLKKSTELRYVKTWYEVKKFIPAPKKGKMKLYTKEVAAEEQSKKEGEKPKKTVKSKKIEKKSLKKEVKAKPKKKTLPKKIKTVKKNVKLKKKKKK